VNLQSMRLNDVDVGLVLSSHQSAQHNVAEIPWIGARSSVNASLNSGSTSQRLSTLNADDFKRIVF
jgi:hypothetical protein